MILDEAKEIIQGERREAYGPVHESFEKIARLWSEVMGYKVTPQQVALCMVQLKIAREIARPKKDNRIDIINYAALLDQLHENN